jgi:peptidoglycan hydrolase-like protein with peptidoglycan-binding domain
MPLLTGVITSETISSGTVKTDRTSWPVLSTVSVATLKQLHTELAAVGLPVLGAEATGTPQFGPETVDRVRAFQKLHGLPATGALDPTTGGVMALAALVTTESDPSKLRDGLRAAQSKVPNSPQYNYMLARSAILAGDPDLAMKVAPSAGDLGLSAGTVLDILSASPDKPDVPFPENFYSYRYELMSQDLIVELRTNAPARLSARLIGQPDLAGSGEPAADDQARRTIVALRPRQDPNGDPPGVPEVPPLPPPTPNNIPKALADSAQAWLEAMEAWQLGNAEFAKQRYASAVAAYNACQQATLAYFALFPDYEGKFSLTAPTLAGRMDELILYLASDTAFWSDVWTHINFRRQRLTLEELGQIDWIAITRVHGIFQLLEGNLAGKRDPLPPTNPLPTNFRKALMDARLVVIAAVLVPLARAEANRLRRQYAAALDDLTRFQRRALPLPNSDPPTTVPAALACEFIEYPFARLLAAETLLDQAEAQYKSRLSVDDEPDATKKAVALARLKSLADDFTNRHIPSGGSDASRPFQNLVAALTYSSVLESQQSDGEYLPRAKQAVDRLYAAVTSAVDKGDVTSMAFQSLGQTVTVRTIDPIGNSLPGLTNGTHPHEPFLQFKTPAGKQAM